MMFIDPAANLYLGNGFTSATWYGQIKDEFWAGYPPLYSLLLYAWMRVYGLSLATARSLNILLTVITAFLLWVSVQRLHLVKTASARISLVLLLLFIQNYTFNLTAGRPDPLMLLITTLVLLVSSIRSQPWRYGGLVAVCTLFPLTGLSLVVYSVISVALVLIFLQGKFVAEAIAIAIGLFAGLVTLYGIYQANGVWDQFIFSTKNNPTLVGHNLASSLSESLRFGGFLQNRNFQILLTLLISIAIYRILKRDLQWRSTICFGLAASFVIPLGMRFAGAYLFYNGWMASLPLIICLCSNWEQLPIFRIKQWMVTALSGLLLTVCILGPHLRIIDLITNWQALDQAPVSALIERNVSSQDWVFSDSLAYYAAKPKAAVTMTHWYRSIITPSEKQQVSVLILRPELFESTVHKLGGQWEITPDQVTLQTHNLLKKRQNLITLNVYKPAVNSGL
ncbi:MAG: hypothetical protein SFW36_07250 [Leptolyngbyaceae cyanobacterium bins.59]|nr:hypothetical protein [Leptolyngbyaceae cyanobacterium bins.59]